MGGSIHRGQRGHDSILGRSQASGACNGLCQGPQDIEATEYAIPRRYSQDDDQGPDHYQDHTSGWRRQPAWYHEKSRGEARKRSGQPAWAVWPMVASMYMDG